jgi:hypothetical protein
MYAHGIHAESEESRNGFDNAGDDGNVESEQQAPQSAYQGCLDQFGIGSHRLLPFGAKIR